MRYLGIDLGETKVGLAHADSSVMLALPIGTLVPSKNVNDIRWIMPIIEEYSVEEIVGLIFNPLILDFEFSSSTNINYFLYAKKNKK